MKFSIVYSALLIVAGLLGHQLLDVLAFLGLAWGAAFVYRLDRGTKI